jgi:hypothetical protein
MISLLEYPMPQRSNSVAPIGPMTNTLRPRSPMNSRFVRMGTPVRRASLSTSVPSVPSKNNLGLGNIDRMRRNVSVSPTTGTKMSSTGLKLAGKNVPPGTAIMNVPVRRLR